MVLFEEGAIRHYGRIVLSSYVLARRFGRRFEADLRAVFIVESDILSIYGLSYLLYE